MGKKAKKTRWRTLPIEVGSPANENQHHHHHHNHQHNFHNNNNNNNQHYTKHYVSHEKHEETSRLCSSSPITVETKTFNEDEYTKITTPRQDVLFKKGYLARRRLQQLTAAAAEANIIIPDQSPYELQNGDYAEDEDFISEDCDMQGYYNTPQAYTDPSGGVYYNYGNSYEMYDPYTGNVTVVMGPPPGQQQYTSNGHPVLTTVPCQSVPMQSLEWYNHPPPPHHTTPYVCHNNNNNNYSKQEYNIHSSESSMCPPTSPQDICEDPSMYPQSFLYPGYMLTNSQGFNPNGVHIPPPLPQSSSPPPCDIASIKKRKRRKKRKREGFAEDGSESSSEDQRSQSGASEQLDSKTTSDSGVHTHNSGESTPVTPPLSISLHPNITCQVAPPFTSTDEDSTPDVSAIYNGSVPPPPISYYNNNSSTAFSSVPVNLVNYSSPMPFTQHVNFNNDLIVVNPSSASVIDEQYVMKPKKLKQKKPKSEYNFPNYSIPCSFQSRDNVSVPYEFIPSKQQKPYEQPKQVTILKPPESPNRRQPMRSNIKILKPTDSLKYGIAAHDLNNTKINDSNSTKPEVLPGIVESKTESCFIELKDSSFENITVICSKDEKKKENSPLKEIVNNVKEIQSKKELIIEETPKLETKESLKTKIDISGKTTKEERKSISPEKIITKRNSKKKNVNHTEQIILKDNKPSTNETNHCQNEVALPTNTIKTTCQENGVLNDKMIDDNLESEVKSNEIVNRLNGSIETEKTQKENNANNNNVTNKNESNKLTEKIITECNGELKTNQKQKSKSKKNKLVSQNNEPYQCNGVSESNESIEVKKVMSRTEIIADDKTKEINETRLNGNMVEPNVKNEIIILNSVDMNDNCEDSKIKDVSDKLCNGDSTIHSEIVFNSFTKEDNTKETDEIIENKFETGSEFSEDLEEVYVRNNPLLANLIDIAELKNEGDSNNNHKDNIQVNDIDKNDTSMLNGTIVMKAETKISEIEPKNEIMTENELKNTKQSSDGKIENIEINGFETKIETETERVNKSQKNKQKRKDNTEVSKKNSTKQKIEKSKVSPERKNKVIKMELNGFDESNETLKDVPKIETEKIIQEEVCTEKKLEVQQNNTHEKSIQNKSIKNKIIPKTTQDEPIQNGIIKTEINKNSKSPSPEKNIKRRNSKKKSPTPPTPPVQNKKTSDKDVTSKTAKTFIDDVLTEALKRVDTIEKDKKVHHSPTIKSTKDIKTICEIKPNVNKKSKGNRDVVKETTESKPIIKEEKIEKQTVAKQQSPTVQTPLQISKLVNKWLMEEHGGRLPLEYDDDDDDEEIFIQPNLQKETIDTTGSKNLKSNPSPVVFLNEIMGERVANSNSDDIFEKCNAKEYVNKYYNLGIRATPETEVLTSDTVSNKSSQNSQFRHPAGSLPSGMCCHVQ